MFTSKFQVQNSVLDPMLTLVAVVPVSRQLCDSCQPTVSLKNVVLLGIICSFLRLERVIGFVEEWSWDGICCAYLALWQGGDTFVLQGKCRSQRISCRNWFSSSTMWVPRIKRRVSGFYSHFSISLEIYVLFGNFFNFFRFIYIYLYIIARYYILKYII